jgi:hypothetical protein
MLGGFITGIAELPSGRACSRSASAQPLARSALSQARAP